MKCVDRTNNRNRYGLVVMTPASHAGGRGFDPPFLYYFYFLNKAIILV